MALKALIYISGIFIYAYLILNPDKSVADCETFMQHSALDISLNADTTVTNGPTVLVSFVVDKKGNVGNIKILKNECYQCSLEQKNRMEKAAIKMITKEQYTPGRQNGKAVKVKYTLPVRFPIVGDSVYIP